LQRDKGRGKKSSPEKTEKKDVDWTNDSLCPRAFRRLRPVRGESDETLDR